MLASRILRGVSARSARLSLSLKPSSSPTCGGLRCAGYVTVDEAKQAANDYSDMSDEALAIMSSGGDHEATVERLVRNIMAVDEVSWEQAQPKLQAVRSQNSSGMSILTLPYKVGIATGFIAAFGTIPLCFDLPTALWFNEAYVTTDVPEPADLETWLEVVGALDAMATKELSMQTGLEALPGLSFGGLTSLTSINMGGCEGVTSLPEGLFGGLTSLTSINMSYSSGLDQPSVSRLEGLAAKGVKIELPGEEEEEEY